MKAVRLMFERRATGIAHFQRGPPLYPLARHLGEVGALVRGRRLLDDQGTFRRDAASDQRFDVVVSELFSMA